MKNIGKNIKWIVIVIILVVISSGIGVYAGTTYLASQVIYKDNIYVSSALDDLYSKIPKGKKTITDNESGNQVDVSEFQYVDTTGITGKGTSWNSGSGTSKTKDVSLINVGFIPSKIFIFFDVENAHVLMYNSVFSTSEAYNLWYGGENRATPLNSTSTNGANIRTIGENVTFYTNSAVNYNWYAIK